MSSWNFEDLTGKRFGYLTVISYGGKASGGRTLWLCQCDCGKQKVIRSYNLKSGGTISCGCHKYALAAMRLTTHGDSKSRLYRIWWDMIHRCEYAGSNRYDIYGGRGISVCAEWRSSFESFRDWAIRAGYNDDLSIDRIDSDGNYAPENCRWATSVQQANNKRRNKNITYLGETHTLAEWSRILNFSYRRINQRMVRDGKTFAEALNTNHQEDLALGRVEDTP